MVSILSVSYDQVLLTTRQQVLQTKGYAVTSVRGMSAALKACSNGASFDLLILGHSIPHAEKQTIIEAFRANRPEGPVIALKRHGEKPVRDADLEIEPNPPELLEAVAKLISGMGTAASVRLPE